VGRLRHNEKRPRLVGARLREDDFENLLALRRDPQVAAWLGGIPTVDHVRRRPAAFLEHWKRYGYGLWVLRRQQDDVFIGYVGLRRVTIEGRCEVELLYALAPGNRRQGLASEATRAVAALAFERLGLESIAAWTPPADRASQRVMAKTGLVHERDLVHGGLLHGLYRLRNRRTRHPPA
jgi:RimJ/RimL family protein N-acetyltransferase